MQAQRLIRSDFSPLLALGVALMAGCGCPRSDETATATAAPSTTAGGESAAQAAPLSRGALLDAALAGDHRSEANRARDASRHPKETLLFFGLTPDMTVVEMAPGGGWYTEVLAPVLYEQGRLVGAIPDPKGPAVKYAAAFLQTLRTQPDVFDRVDTVIFEPPNHGQLGPSGSADMVVTFRSVHGWVNRDQAQASFAAMFEVLKPGGVLGLVQHRAAEGADVQESSPAGYLPESHVIALAERAGFVLEERSEINANPRDTRNHPKGVWSLPPNLAGGDEDREKFVAIGESDRMTLRFRKPAAQND